MQKPHKESIHKVTCYHDGECPLCQFEIKQMKKVDRQTIIEWIDITKDTAALSKAGINYQQAMDRIHVIDARHTMQTGVRGFLAIWEHLPYYRRVVPFIRLPIIFPIIELSYRIFAQHRLALTGRKNRHA
ncbi:MAG: DUF393 domain-containing protein [Cocleimonas sp.]|nr:DUF393 domain-containing protein [Cocleimonas sp.]